MRELSLVLLVAGAAGAQDLVVFRDRAEAPREQLVRYLNAIGERQLAARRAEVARLTSVEGVEKRKKAVREKLLRLIGGLPEYRGPLNVKSYGTLDRGDYRIEKIVYESLPGFYVPANVYVPARGKGPFPAVLMPVGHGVDGKAGSRQIAVGLALKGFLALAFDPLGQGERVQYWDPDLRASKVGGPTDEHSHSNGHTILIGDNVARYRIWDGMRGIDYLLTRPDVDRNRIGCTGCSGGGTLTTYISALDDRVKAAAPSCYMNSWEELLKGPGPQDAEQSFPNFLSEGLNIADYVELFAPKPWLLVSTIEDFFPLEGARQTYEEARRIYGLYKAEDRIAWRVGPGGHGTPQPSREAIYEWFLRWLKNGEGDAREPEIPPEDPNNLLCTPTGQVADSLGGETVFTLNKKRAADLIPLKRALDRSRLEADIRELAAITAQPGRPAPQATSHRQFPRHGYTLEVVSLDVEPGIRLPGLLLVPDGEGPKAAVLAVDSRSKDLLAAPGGDLEDLARAGYLVFLLQPRGMAETPQTARSSFLGDASLPMRALVVGKNLLGMRVEDIFRAVDYLASRPDVDRGRIVGFGQGAGALALLHAAVLDTRIGRLVLQDCLASYRSAVDRPLHRGLYEVAIPGVVRRYDIGELVEALKPREATLLNPVDALGRPMKMDGARVRGRRDSLRQFLPATERPGNAAAGAIVDGELNEAMWQRAEAGRLGPDEIRLAVRGSYLYVGARMSEPEGRFTARSIGRNPQWEEEDVLRVLVGAYPDWIVQVGPLGTYSVETKNTVVHNERFLAAARIGEREWTAEIAIPLNDLKAARLEEIRVSVERVRAMRPGMPERRWRWPEAGPAAKLPDPEAEGPAPVFRPAWVGNREPPLQVGRTAALRDDAAWQKTPAWSLRRNEPDARLLRHPGEVKMLHDGRTLSVMARLAEPDPEETFEVYLATTGSAYVQFGLTPAGALAEAVGMSGGPRISRPRTDWKSGATGVARKQDGAWTARLDIPLEAAARALGEERAPPDWRVLLLRSRPGRDGEPRETSVLPVTETDTPLCPARYRPLRLSEGATGRGDDQATERVNLDVIGPSAGMVQAHLRARVRAILDNERREWEVVRTREDWERFRDRRMQALAASLGKFPERGPLQVQVTKEFAGEGYRRQDLVYQSRPGLWVTANLYLPAPAREPAPAILIVHSHHRPRTQAELQDMGILWARAGAAVLVPDQIGAGERLQNYPWNREAYHSRYIMGMQLYLAGESLIHWMVWDIRRGVDLLVERPDIDPKRIVLLGAVAGGGDPAAVAAAVEARIAAVAPFNFGESTPESPRFVPEKNRWPLELADPGWGSWETTRNLRGSIAGQFFPWLICASVAPRRFVYSFEMGWKVEDLPAWKRYQKVFGLYGALDNLDEAHGFGPFPGPGECTNIGPAQRQTLYPELERWFGIRPPAKEPDDRRPESELAALTPDVAARLNMRPVHELALEIARARLAVARATLAKLAPAARRDWLRWRWKEKLGDIEPNRSPQATARWTKPLLGVEARGIALEVEPGITVPMVVLRPGGNRVVVIVSQGGKERLLLDRRSDIEALLKAGTTVCLPDVRGAGETAPDGRRGPLGSGISLAATELMLGNTMLGARLKDLRTVLAYLGNTQPIALWGDSHVPLDPPHFLLDELPGWQVGPDIQHQAEPLGGLLALLGALYEDSVAEVAVRRGLSSYLSVLEDRFAYLPSDVIVPGILEAGDLPDLVAALAPRPVKLVDMVDARNRLAE